MSKPDVISIGSLVIDVINGKKSIGGAAANTAVNMRLLGLDTGLLTGVSEEVESTEYQNHLRSLGILVHGLSGFLDSLPRCVIDMGDNGEEIGFEWHGNGIEELFESSEVDEAIIHSSPYLYLAICEHTFAQRVTTAVQDYQLLAYNPGSRVEGGIDAFQSIQQRADHIFLNHKEYQHLVNEGYVSSPTQLVTRDKQEVVVTAGKSRTQLVTRNGIEYFDPETVTAVDETGAGDSFASTFLWAKSIGHSSQRAVRLGNLMASLVVQQYGCQITQETANLFKKEAKKRGLLE